MINRRALLQGALGVVLATSFVGRGAARAAPASAADARLAALLQRLAEEHLRLHPEEATRLDFDAGANLELRSRLDDRSLDGVARERRFVAHAVQQLDSVERSMLSAASRLDFDVASFVYRSLEEQLAGYGFVDINLRPSPYVVSQMNGAYYWLPEFLGSRHPLRSAPDVEAYFARLNALGAALDGETQRIRHDAERGVILPDFTLQTTLGQLRSLLQASPAESAMISPAIARARAAKLGELRERATEIFERTIKPALARQVTALQALEPRARDEAGVWALPDGEQYYARSLRSNTTADVAAPALHRQGLQWFAELRAQLDASLRTAGLTRGGVAERIQALSKDSRYLVSNDDAGRERLLDAARVALERATAALPSGFKTIPSDPIEVTRIPVAIERGAPGAFYSDGAAGQPATFSLNLSSPGETPLWRLPTLAHHEGVPGHHFQHSVLKAAGELALFRRFVRFSAYTEGWALYAERLAEELGVYRDDPVGRIGMLQSELFRAARIVVDTGIHDQRWTRSQAIRWMVENVGEPPGAAQREIDRYCVYPGQACSFMVGAKEIRAARERARARMGSRFDVREFHELVLRSGPVPIAVLHAAVDHWSS